MSVTRDRDPAADHAGQRDVLTPVGGQLLRLRTAATSSSSPSSPRAFAKIRSHRPHLQKLRGQMMMIMLGELETHAAVMMDGNGQYECPHHVR